MTLGNGYLAGQGPRILYRVNGEFNDWTYGDLTLKPRSFTWTPEVGGPSDGFWPAPSRILPLAQETLRLSYYTALVAGPFVRVERADIVDGPLAAGFNYHLAVRARNKGVAGNAGPALVANLTSLSAGASVLTGAIGYPTLAPLTSGDALGGGTFMIAVDDTVTPGRLLRFSADFSAPGGFFSRDTVELVCGVPTVVAADGASSGLGQWTPGTWGIVADDPGHPSRYFADSPAGAYGDNANNALTLIGPLNLSAGVHAYAFYDARWQFESDYDCAVIEASLNGTTWVPLTATGSSRGTTGGVQPVGQPARRPLGLHWCGWDRRAPALSRALRRGLAPRRARLRLAARRGLRPGGPARDGRGRRPAGDAASRPLARCQSRARSRALRVLAPRAGCGAARDLRSAGTERGDAGRRGASRRRSRERVERARCRGPRGSGGRLSRPAELRRRDREPAPHPHSLSARGTDPRRAYGRAGGPS
jgi:hypothetical protein